jgi:hypothetical protein
MHTVEKNYAQNEGRRIVDNACFCSPPVSSCRLRGWPCWRSRHPQISRACDIVSRLVLSISAQSFRRPWWTVTLFFVLFDMDVTVFDRCTSLPLFTSAIVPLHVSTTILDRRQTEARLLLGPGTVWVECTAAACRERRWPIESPTSWFRSTTTCSVLTYYLCTPSAGAKLEDSSMQPPDA